MESTNPEIPKLRIVFYEAGGEISYFYLEKSEALRVLALLKILPEITDWTSLSRVAAAIETDVLVTQWTLLKMAGAKYIDILKDGKREVLTKEPFLLIKKGHIRPNPRYKYLRPSIYIKKSKKSHS